MIMHRPRIFEDREFTQPTTPWLWKDNDVQLQKTPAGWAVLDDGETVYVSGTVSGALIVFDSLTEGTDDGTKD